MRILEHVSIPMRSEDAFFPRYGNLPFIKERKLHAQTLLGSYQEQIAAFDTLLQVSNTGETLKEAADFFRGTIVRTYTVESTLFDGTKTQKVFENNLSAVKSLFIKTCHLDFSWDKQEVTYFRRKFEVYKHTPIDVHSDGTIIICWDKTTPFLRWRRSQVQISTFHAQIWQQNVPDFVDRLFTSLQYPIIGITPIEK